MRQTAAERAALANDVMADGSGAVREQRHGSADLRVGRQPVMAGKRADLVVLDGDPYDLRDMAERVRQVWKDGRRVDQG